MLFGEAMPALAVPIFVSSPNSLTPMAKKTKAPIPEVSAVSEQPYYLQRAHIKDFRSIRDAKVEFKPGLNIIIGANGSGKTNLVVGVAEALDFSTNIIEHIQHGEFVLSGRNDVLLTCEKELPVESKVKNKNRFFNLFIEHTSNIEVVTKNHRSTGSSLAEAVANNQDLVQKSIFFQPILIKYGVPEFYSIANSLTIGRSGNEYNWVNEIGLARLVSRVMTEDIVASNYLSEDSFNKDSIIEIIDEVSGFYINQMREYLIRYSPVKDVRLASSIQIYRNSSQEETKIRGISLDFKINNDWLPFDDLSSGTKRIVYLIFETIQPADYNFKKYGIDDYASNDDRIVFIEEPELGIHPDQLHKLLLFLREQSEKHQIIITTHSPQVLDMLTSDELDRITICELDEKKGTQFRKLTKKKIATAQKFMKDVGYLSDFWLYSSLEEKSQAAS